MLYYTVIILRKIFYLFGDPKMNADTITLIKEQSMSFFDAAKGIFLGFTWADAVDILLLTLFFGFVFTFLKSRKAGTLIFGIVACLVIYSLAVIFDFSGVKYILSGIFQFGALAFIIIFQPELRDLFEKMGGSLMGIRGIADQSHKKQAQYKAIDNICKAVHVMSAEKTGALIVLERTTQLDEVRHSGVIINADVSDSLIRNLFYNRAPLHDGALVIDSNKIVAAACILPLPKHTAVDSELGTRHRAAVGMSEVSDAIIIVVSEETGTVSVAKESELKRGFTEDSLRKFLVKELVRDKQVQENN